jgi:hypothetical protein
MNVVLYTTDLEPITILDLPIGLLEQLERHGAVRVAVQEPFKFTPAPEDFVYHQPKTVTIYCEKFCWRDGRTKTILVTPDDEVALILKPSWLPGQTGTIQGYQKNLRFLTDQLIRAMRK